MEEGDEWMDMWVGEWVDGGREERVAPLLLRAL